MRQYILILTFFTLFSCQSRTTTEKTTETNSNEVEADDIFCDSTKVRDFRNNLEISKDEITAIEKEYQDKKAKTYIDEACEKDSLFCGTIRIKTSKVYIYDEEWKILSTGYVLGESAMEESSASFFVTTIYRNNEPQLTEFFSDLTGEIKLELNGFEVKKGRVNIWGHVYPYLDPDYGKFRLTFENGLTSYEFECHEQH